MIVSSSPGTVPAPIRPLLCELLAAESPICQDPELDSSLVLGSGPPIQPS
jgi:hypothetical protein